MLRGPCGSWLASDGVVAVCQAARRDVIGSHRYWVPARDLCAARALWELACQRWGSCGLSGRAQGCHRLPQVLGHSPGFVCCAGLVGAGLPAMEQLRSVRQRAGMSSPASRLPQVLGHSPGFVCCAGLVGAGLPAMGELRSVRQRAGMSSAPTGIGSQPGICVLRGPCGSWLASDGGVAVCQAARRDVIGSHGYWVPARDLCAARALWKLACQRWGSCGLSGRAPQASSPMDRERVKTPSASRCCFCVQPLWAHRRNNPGAGQSVGGCGKCPGAFRKWCTCATCDPGTGSRYCSCAAG